MRYPDSALCDLQWPRTPMQRLDKDCLLALDRERELERAAWTCGLGLTAFAEVLDSLALSYGQPLVRWHAGRFAGFTSTGQVALQSAKFAAVDPSSTAALLAHDEDRVSRLLARRSVAARRLRPPAPTADQLDLMIQVALCAPDHGALRPWRIIEFTDIYRERLADLFEEEKLRRDPRAERIDRLRSREHAQRPPMLLAFVVSLVARSKVPEHEQWLAAGAALGNLLNAAHELGFGAILLSGERCGDPELLAQVGVQAHERLAGFISIGRPSNTPPPRPPVLSGTVWTRWCPPTVVSSAASEAVVAKAGRAADPG